ncbi:arginyl-tRNA--protein transferase 1 isoform X3 [Anopheles moucheti]|uniref:arginyl-tRNA--protein transferase 1 isoform X3 n=1 Tax=Anopheles moucheti TaxID=186751 RepID=UPI0022F010F4|nr:arginyl-tRNA--protein transferase 1 isoform X3 [Anopheles moucheti]
MAFSIVEYYGENSRYQCGYCKQSRSCSSYGMWAHKLCCQDYQELIDRGWRRSGCYCYKPMMEITCCPSYTIKCDAMNFRLNKSHKKIIKRMNKFLRDGKQDTTEMTVLSNSEETTSHDTGGHEHMEVPCVQPKPLDPSLMGLDTNDSDECRPVADESGFSGLQIPKLTESLGVSVHQSDSNASNQPKKAKMLRIERKREKLQKKGLSGEAIEQMMKPSGNKNKEKSLEDFLEECPQKNNKPVHHLQVKCVVASEGATATTFKLYSLYQQSIHKDPLSKLNMDRFKRFLVKSPLKDSQEYGTFHQQYWLDDRLIAVGVIDVLPFCVSSVYFFYDPEFKFLSLGTYGSLRELAFTRSLNRKIPSIKNYYMGFYIHSCPKMRYKSNLQPSYLLCPEAYTWHLLDKTVLAKLDAHKYSRLNDDVGALDANKTTEQDLKDVLLLVGRSYTTYSEYLEMVGKGIPFLSEYARLVGKSCAKKMMLYRV